MTRNQILWLCIAISCCLHLWTLDRDWSTETRDMGGEEFMMPADFTMAAATPMAHTLALVQAEAPDDPHNAESAARRKRRLAREQYFQRVRAAVERNKFRYNADLSGLLGNALYSFRILPDDTFTDIQLRRSSGDPLLDKAALNAIETASGRVKRPRIIGPHPFHLSIAIKYQLSM
jgi:TonB family C-terminal domain